MKVIQIVAKGENNEIGCNNEMLWHLPKDFKMFKESTLNNYVIMGRKTFESIGELKQRQNIIITRKPNEIKISKKSWVSSSFKETINFISSSINKKNKYKILFVIGGQSIYEQTIDLCDEIWITEVHSIFKNADTFYNIDLSDFVEYSRIKNYKDEKHCYDFDFVKYNRITKN